MSRWRKRMLLYSKTRQLKNKNKKVIYLTEIEDNLLVSNKG